MLKADEIAIPYKETWLHLRPRYEYIKLNPECILFKEKIYPLCQQCNFGYLPELGCVWCKIVSHGTDYPR